MKITNHHELRKRFSIDAHLPKLTEQMHKKSCDINYIVAQFHKTGILPTSDKIAQYIDNTGIIPLEDAFKLVSEAHTAFLDLPADIRRLMDNDPSKMENFIQNPDNADILHKYGIIEHKPIPEPEVTLREINKTLKDLKVEQKPTEKV